jgi:hypothetical protein
MLLDEWEAQQAAADREAIDWRNVRIVTVRRYSFTTPAYVAAAQLREAGIECTVQESFGTSNVFVEQGTIQLNVRAEQAGDARLLLEQLEQTTDQEPTANINNRSDKSVFWVIATAILCLALFLAWRNYR